MVSNLDIMDKSFKGQLALEYLEKYPKALSQTLARKMHEENPGVFKDVEDARDKIRYYRGAHGEHARLSLKDTKFKDIWAKVELPDPIDEPREDFIMPQAQNEILLLSDVHVPYHSNEALTTAVNWAKPRSVNTVIINGDFVDFYAWSKFIQDPRQVNVRRELDMAYETMYWLRDQLPDCVFYFLPGNHEYRYERYLMIQAPRLIETSEYHLDILLRFGELGVHYLEYKQLINVNGLFVGHGDEVKKGGAGVNPARGFFLKTKTNYIGGHFHQTSSHSEKSLDRQIRTWSVGCLCGLTPKYMPYNNWNHGFARIRQSGNGYDVFNAEITNGRITG